MIGVRFSADTKGLTDFLGRYIRNYPVFSDRSARSMAMKAKNRIQSELVRRRHVVSFDLYNSITARKISHANWGVFALDYLKDLESGMPAGTIVPKTIKTMFWARKHGMSFYKMRSIIKKKGTKAYPFTRSIFLKLKQEQLKDMKKKYETFIKTRCQIVDTQTFGG